MEVNKTRNEIIQDRQMEIRLKKGKLPGIYGQVQRLIHKCLHSITVRNHSLIVRPRRAHTENLKQQLLLLK